jgi:hypothetical protein
MGFRMSLDQIIEYTKLFQDIELATAVSQLKKDPARLQQFLQGQQSTVFNDITKQKDSTFQKVYGDLERASQAQESTLMYNKRNMELAQIQEQIYENQKNSATAITDDKSLANRKYEMNEWSVNNKRDTLFIFSMLLIVLASLVVLTVLWRMGLISAGLWVAIGAPIIIIFLLTLISRSQYTSVLRDQRYWNRQKFPSGKKVPIPTCADLSNIGDNLSSMRDNITQGLASAARNTSQGIESAAQGINQLATGISSELTNLADKA